MIWDDLLPIARSRVPLTPGRRHRCRPKRAPMKSRAGRFDPGPGSGPDPGRGYDILGCTMRAIAQMKPTSSRATAASARLRLLPCRCRWRMRPTKPGSGPARPWPGSARADPRIAGGSCSSAWPGSDSSRPPRSGLCAPRHCRSWSRLATPARLTAGGLRGHQADIGHQLARAGKARKIADLRHHDGRVLPVDPAQGAAAPRPRDTRAQSARLVLQLGAHPGQHRLGPLQAVQELGVAERQGGVIKVLLHEPAPVRLGPGGLALDSSRSCSRQKLRICCLARTTSLNRQSAQTNQAANRLVGRVRQPRSPSAGRPATRTARLSASRRSVLIRSPGAARGQAKARSPRKL